LLDHVIIFSLEVTSLLHGLLKVVITKIILQYFYSLRPILTKFHLPNIRLILITQEIRFIIIVTTNPRSEITLSTWQMIATRTTQATLIFIKYILIKLEQTRTPSLEQRISLHLVLKFFTLALIFLVFVLLLCYI